MIIHYDSYTTTDGLIVYQARLEGSTEVHEATSPEAAIGRAVLDAVVIQTPEAHEICEDCMSGEQLKCLEQIKRYKRINTPRAFATAKQYWTVKWPNLRPEGIEWN